MSQTSVFGIVKSYSQAEQLVEELQAEGFPASEISVLLPDSEGRHDIGHVKATKAPEGATTGATAGGVTGGVLGLLAGIGALAIPGVGPFIAAGPIIGVLGGMGVGGAVGGLTGGLIGAGIPEYEAKRYEGRIRKGGMLLSVHCDDSDWIRRAEKILRDTGAEDVASAAEAKADYAVADRPRIKTNESAQVAESGSEIE